MLTRLFITLRADEDKKLNYNMGSIMQGVIMEFLDTGYAESLHVSALKPYSQYLLCPKDKDAVWNVSTLNKKAYENLIVPLKLGLEKAGYIHLKNKDIKAEVMSVEQDTTTYSEMIRRYYMEGEAERFKKLFFLTPASFKSGGEYQIFPNSRWIVQNLMQRFDAFSDKVKIFDDEVLKHLEENVIIKGYNMRTLPYSIERVKIPGFAGRLDLVAKGAATLVNLFNLLLAFSEYSGIGIKTAMGMGGVRVE